MYGGSLIVDEDDLILDQASTLETENGTVIKELYEQNRKPVSISQLPSYVPNAFIAIEDRRFREHGGIDVRSIARAAVTDLLAGQKKEGGSTITQQVIKNLVLSHEKTFMRKTKELMAAVYLERHYSKDQILELYMNAVYFGNGAYGVEQASRTYFGKHAKELTASEAATLAGMVQSPANYSPFDHPDEAKMRRNTVLNTMASAGFLTASELEYEKRKPLAAKKSSTRERPWVDSYVDMAMKEAADKYQLSIEELKRGGYRIVLGMDEVAQRIAYGAFQKDHYFPGNKEGAEGAFVLMDEKNGEIKALIGGRNYQLGDLNRAAVKRQPGSTMKPLAVYGPALMKKYNPYSLLVDQKIAYGGGYTAANYDGQYDNYVTMYNSIIESKNAPAVWLLNEIGVPYAKDYLDKMQLSVADEGLALALGGLEEGLTPMQIAAAYRTFIHEGQFKESYVIKAVYDHSGKKLKLKKSHETKVFSRQAAWYMVEMLEQTVKKGTARAGSYNKALAGKTGSTQHPLAAGKTKDAWFAGMTPDYSFALWMGYDKSDKEHYLKGGSEYPTMLAKSILSELDREKGLSTRFKKPKGVKALPEPIEMPDIKHPKAKFALGGYKLVKAKLTWEADPADKRIIYHIYKVKPGIDERVGEVKGETSITLEQADLFKTSFFYIVPYDPLTKLEGERSELVELSL